MAASAIPPRQTGQCRAGPQAPPEESLTCAKPHGTAGFAPMSLQQDLPMRALALVTAFCLSALAPAHADEIPGTQFKTGFWEGAANTNPDGSFSHCDVSVGFSGGATLWMALYSNDTLSVLLSHPDVRFRTGDTFDSWLMLETGLPTRGTSEAWDDAFAGMTLEGIDASISFLTQGTSLRLLGIGIDEAFDVSGITEALGLAKDCHAAQITGTTGGAGAAGTVPKVPDILKPRTGTAGGGLGTRPGGTLGTPAPKPQP
ncbi:MAG: hypothetical protein EAZ40_00015 [Rhodobacterales bacterium]|nr:MAG: hypothetical protein EAZ40_00015 [Rhodobacterales bacterium]